MFSMLAIVALQNLVAYSVNMADNIMLGRYSQDALSGAATANQVFFIVQQFAIALGNALVALASQYYGQDRLEQVRKITGITLKLALAIGAVITAICIILPEWVIGIFTTDEAIIAEGKDYITIIAWTFILFLVTNVFMAALRVSKTVNISFYISIVSLVINVCINYVLIFGKLGFPEMGIKGAAIGTLIARIAELAIVMIYIAKFDKSLHIFSAGWLSSDRLLFKDFIKVCTPIVCSSVLWAVSVPMQTAILGHISEDAIAANSVATTFYQYLKVIVVAMSSTSSVMIGTAIGKGDIEEVKAYGRTLSVIDVLLGLFMGSILLLLKDPLLSLYADTFNSTALDMASNLIIIMSVVMVGMSYQMPVCFGIIQGGGDGRFNMAVNMISTWCIVMPLSFLAAYTFKWPVELVVICVQSDQIFKCLPAFLHFRKYKWIKNLTR